MLQFSARKFFWAASVLEQIKLDCYLGSLPIDGGTPAFHVAAMLDDRARTKALNSLGHVEQQFSELALRISAETVKEVMLALQSETSSHNFQWLIEQIRAIHKLADKEMKDKTFFYVPAERTKFFPTTNKTHIFGEAVGKAFPSAAYDISEAGTCLALARGTACVFHVMRVLEIGLAALGNKFGVSLANTNWGPAIDQIERKIKGMRGDPAWSVLPDCKQQQEFYAQAASHFGILKDAWRNYTMHVRGFYTEEQAVQIFENAKSFMQKLAERLSE
jgi:hypothetical protein